MSNYSICIDCFFLGGGIRRRRRKRKDNENNFLQVINTWEDDTEFQGERSGTKVLESITKIAPTELDTLSEPVIDKIETLNLQELLKHCTKWGFYSVKNIGYFCLTFYVQYNNVDTNYQECCSFSTISIWSKLECMDCTVRGCVDFFVLLLLIQRTSANLFIIYFTANGVPLLTPEQMGIMLL